MLAEKEPSILLRLNIEEVYFLNPLSILMDVIMKQMYLLLLIHKGVFLNSAL